MTSKTGLAGYLRPGGHIAIAIRPWREQERVLERQRQLKWVGYSDDFQGEQRERQQDRDNCVGHTLTSSGGTEFCRVGGTSV